MKEKNGEATMATLTRMCEDWLTARARREMAQQTLLGAQSEEIAKEARFKGALELLCGPDVTFEYANGKLKVTPAKPTATPTGKD